MRSRRRWLFPRLTLVLAALGLTIAVAACGSSTATKTTTTPKPSPPASSGAGTSAGHHSTVTGAATGNPGTTPVPILMYHVINPPPAGAKFPGLYVPAGEFAAQMQALKAAGWHAVTLDQVEAYWKRGVPLGPGKPVVLTFDNGYQSQYTNALPVLKRLGWVADENIQLTGLPPSQGGITDAQVKGLVDAGWELDTQGMSHADLIRLGSSQLHNEVVTARQMLKQRYGVSVNWFCYPSGHYDANVISVVKDAGYVGSTTVIPGWASPSQDPYRLPRLRVLGGTSPSALLSQIASAQSAPGPPDSYGGAGTA
jgi:peptidoglycan/xylan/chitin deacetylase (PgdA/CDA1 family)